MGIRNIFKYFLYIDFRSSNRISWFFDEENGWIHIKMVETANRHVDGVVHENMIVESKSYNYTASEYFHCSPEHGCLRFKFDLDQDEVDNQFECPVFPLDIVDQGQSLKSIFESIFRSY